MLWNSICLVECIKCSAVFCQGCYEKSKPKRICPCCRKRNLEVKKAFIGAKFLGALSVKCSNEGWQN